MALKPKDFTVGPDPARAETLPPRAFTEPEYLERELKTVFARSWLLLPLRPAAELREDPRGLGEMLKVRGARAPVALLDKPMFLQRGWKDAKLRLFPNVCTHAWYPLVPGPGRGQSLVCAQHGRQFDCAGKALSQPGFSKGKDFPRPQDHLREFPVEDWAGLLFAALGTPASPFERQFKEVAASLKDFPFAKLKRRPQAEEVREVAGNWKQHAWNYMDKFHVSFIHKSPGGLADAVDLTSYKTELYERSSLQWALARDPEAGFEPELLPARLRDPEGRRVFALWWFIFPNLTLNLYPWGLSVNAYMPVPGKPDRTLFLWYAFVLDEAKYARREELWHMTQVDDEDIDAMAQAARGARSGLAPRGRFSPQQEPGPHWFHRLAYLSTFR